MFGFFKQLYKPKVLKQSTWKKILKEYEKNSDKMYLMCSRSETFCKIWKNQRYTIYNIAQSFLEDTNIKDVYLGRPHRKYAALFCCDGSLAYDEAIRMQFIKWMIEYTK